MTDDFCPLIPSFRLHTTTDFFRPSYCTALTPGFPDMINVMSADPLRGGIGDTGGRSVCDTWITDISYIFYHIFCSRNWYIVHLLHGSFYYDNVDGTHTTILL